MQPRISAEQLSDQDLLDAVQRIVGDERQLTAQFIALIAEVDVRQLYLGQSCSSLFTYCTEVLHLSEHAAYCRIAAARCARRLPVVLKMLADGDVTLTTIKLIGPHLTEDTTRCSSLLCVTRASGTSRSLSPRSILSPTWRRGFGSCVARFRLQHCRWIQQTRTRNHLRCQRIRPVWHRGCRPSGRERPSRPLHLRATS